MEENLREDDSLHARIQELEQERNELHKDIEQLCMQTAGPRYISLTTQTYFRRTAGLEQEVENLKKKLADCVKEKSDISDELSEAKRIKSHLDELHKLEVTKNAEVVKQLEYLRGVIANAFSDRDHALVEAEKAKESEELMSQKLSDAEMRLQELSAESIEIHDQVMSLQMELEKQDQEVEHFRKVIDKFYKIRQQACGGSSDEESTPGDLLENVSWDEKCACLSYDLPESWSYNVHQESSSASYVAALLEEVETLRGSLGDLQNKLQMIYKEKSDISDELSEAKRIKSHLDELHKLEVTKNAEVVKQLEYLRGVIANAFSDRDHALVEAEKAKESEELMSQKLSDAEMRLQELSAESIEIHDQVMSLQMELEKQDQEVDHFRKVIDKFYKIRQQACGGSSDEESTPGDLLENVSWDEKCACLSYDLTESWSYNVHQESSSASYVAALLEEVETLRGSLGELQNKLQMGLEIEKHLKNRISRMEQKKILSDRHIVDGISSLREHHNQQRIHIMGLLDDEKSYLHSVVGDVVQTIGKLHRDIQAAEASSRNVPKFADVADPSETLTRALQEKVSALVLLSLQEERHIWEKNVHDTVQETVDELQRHLKLASDQKVKALLELAEVKQQYQLLLKKTTPDSSQGNLPQGSGERRIVALGREAEKPKNLLKRTSLRRWIGTEQNVPAAVYPNLEPEGFSNNQRSNHSLDNARLRIEYDILKDGIHSLERLTSDIRKLRLSLLQAKMTRSSKGASTNTPRQMDETIREAELLKIALSSALPLGWSVESEASSSSNVTVELSNHETFDAEKIDPVSAAGVEMVELIILAAQIMREKKSKRERK